MKKCLCLLLSLTMLCLCAGAALAETVALKVWGSQEDQELLAELCEAFAAEHPETTYEFTYGVVGEADAKARYLEDPAAAADVFLLGRAFEVLISGVVLAVVIGAKRAFNFAQLWRIVLAVLADDVLSQALLPQITFLRCVESSAWDLLVLFTWLTVIDIARHAKADRNVVIGVGWAVYAASFAAGSVHSSWFSLGHSGMAFTTLLMFALAMVGTFFLEVRDQDTKWIFAELSGERVSAPQDHCSIDERCDAIGAERNLTPRELEVMKMLCKGRTKSYIAETLYLTENTVRSHAKHIYTKLDVHSKQELMDLVGA